MKKVVCLLSLVVFVNVLFSQSPVPNPVDSQIIVLPAQWSIISTYIQPLDSNIAQVMNPIVQNIVIVKAWQGLTYWPQYGLNMIGDIDIMHGYQIKMVEADTLAVYGTIANPTNHPVILSTGWDIIPYLRTSSAPIATMMSDIETNIKIVKNGMGQVYWPQWSLNSIVLMNPGEGYQINMNASDILIYPSNGISFNSAFSCGDQIIDYDGNMYNTVLIGNQCWMKENLRSVHYSNGAPIQFIDDDEVWNDLYTNDKAFCYWNDNPVYAPAWGVLYTWGAVMNGEVSSNEVPSGVQGVCPVGWHVPSDEEWKILEGTVDSLYGYPNQEWDTTYWRGSDAGFKLKATSGWFINGNSNPNGNDQYGFSAQAGSYREPGGSFNYWAEDAMFWTSTSIYTIWPIRRYLRNDYNGIARDAQYPNGGLSVRCIRHSDALPTALPTVSTDSIQHISTNRVTIGGKVIEDGQLYVSERGLCWNTTGSPTTSDSILILGSGRGPFSKSQTGFATDTTYYIRAFAINTLGTSYGDEMQFIINSQTITCGYQISDYDGNVYNTVLIGNQCWMQENLRTTHYANGNPLIDGTNAGGIAGNDTTQFMFDYNNNTSYTNVYGKLYTWAAVMGSFSSSVSVPSGVQGICPVGWHVPSNDEYWVLNYFLGGEQVAGGKLKDATNNYWFPLYNQATNESGFTALPCGSRYNDGTFAPINKRGSWWTATGYVHAHFMTLLHNYNESFDQTWYKEMGRSVRCLKD
ncbi:MAG: fibrobacter succinogenes major paralogous domain-containing protein [Bacteroidales bacterium]|nr:fibrobacter succinogenes major paralogous domain-containing protein [Bacteroidales bacterium]